MIIEDVISMIEGLLSDARKVAAALEELKADLRANPEIDDSASEAAHKAFVDSPPGG